MHFIVPMLIIGLCSFPMWTEASTKQQTYKVETKKKLTYKQTQAVKKAVKQNKCKVAIDSKTKKQYYICSK